MSALPFFRTALLGLLLACSGTGLQAAIRLEVLHSFTAPEWSQPSAAGKLVQGPDGNFYGGGTGGPDSQGLIYRVTPAGQVSVVYTLDRSYTSVGELTLGPDGAFYGTATSFVHTSSGAQPWTIFKFTLQGEFTVLASPEGTFGSSVRGPLVPGGDGNFYGVTLDGGAENAGTLFRVTPGGQLTVVEEFTAADGSFPYGGLRLGRDGNIYGSILYAGSEGKGGLFKVDPSGQFSFLAPKVAATFTSPPILLPDGGFAGASGDRVLRVSPAGEVTTLKRWSVATGSVSDLLLGIDGKLYGVFGAPGEPERNFAFQIDPEDSSETELAHFSEASGYLPVSLSQFADGSFYGATSAGASHGAGGVFRLTSGGNLTLLEEFESTFASAYPDGVIQAADGSLFGTVRYGGLHGWGGVYKAGQDGSLQELAAPDAGSSSGEPLVEGSDGNFYGTTQGTLLAPPTAFRVTPEGVVATIATFDQPGEYTPEHLVLGPDGNFYGILSRSTLFKLTPEGGITRLLTLGVAIGDVADPKGYHPNSLICGNDGYLYGTTQGGIVDAGSVFRLGTDGSFVTVHVFDGLDGISGPTSLIQAVDGNFYGTSQAGKIFKLSPDGSVGVIHEFLNDGHALAQGQLLQGSDGALYGVTEGDGLYTSGTIFRLTPDGDFRVLHHLRYLQVYGGTRLSLGKDGDLYGTAILGGDSAVEDSQPEDVPSAGDSGRGIIFAVRMNAPASPADDWLAAHSLTEAPEGDDDHDGLGNLAEYAFGTDPHLADSAPLKWQEDVVVSHGGPVAEFAADPTTGVNMIVYLRRKDRDASGLIYVPQISYDLSYWMPALGSSEVLATDSDFELVSAASPPYISPEFPAFFRVAVFKP